MDYFARYGVDYNPFIKNAKDVLVELPSTEEARLRLDYLARNKGFGVLTGVSGRGKTTLVRHWAQSLNPSLHKVVYTALSTLTVTEFYKQLAELLGLEARNRKSDNFKLIQAEINRYAIEKRITPVIIVDEANYISNAILNDLKMLFNFDMDREDRAVVVLMGLPQLNNTLRLVANEPLRQRITMNYHLEHLNKEEARAYVQGRLKAAGGRVQVFEESALEAVVNGGGGIPRVINKICDACLLIGDSRGEPTITSDIAMHAVNEIELD